MPEEFEQTMTVVAAITASLVKTFDDQKEGFEKLFIGNLETAFRVIHESCPDQKQARDTLARIRDILESMEQ